MNSLLIIFVFNIIICCTCNICPGAFEQATQATTREKLSSGSTTKWVSNQSLQPNRLARKLKFCSQQVEIWFFSKRRQQSCWWDCANAQAGLRIYCDKLPKTGFLSRGPIAICVILPWTIKKYDAKFCYREISFYDNSDRIVIYAVSSTHLQCVCRNAKSYPAGDQFLYHTYWDIRK